MVTTLLPKVVSEVLRRVRQAAAVSGSGAGQESGTPAVSSALTFQSQGSFSTRSSPGYDYQVHLQGFTNTRVVCVCSQTCQLHV
jgi:hypothetical protein